MQVVVSHHDPLCAGSIEDYHVFEARPLLIDSLGGENHAATLKRAQKELAPYNFSPKEIIVFPNRDSIYTEAELGRGVFFSSSMSQTAYSESLTRFDMDIMEGLYCVWSDDGSKYYIKQYAKQLQIEYGKLAERFARTRKWTQEASSNRQVAGQFSDLKTPV
jgi:hypothetical protein